MKRYVRSSFEYIEADKRYHIDHRHVDEDTFMFGVGNTIPLDGHYSVGLGDAVVELDMKSMEPIVYVDASVKGPLYPDHHMTGLIKYYDDITFKEFADLVKRLMSMNADELEAEFQPSDFRERSFYA